MRGWRLPAAIRVKTLGLHWRGSMLLAFEVHDDDGRVKGVRPLGGSVDFGEPARAAVTREFREELGIAVEILSGPVVFENLFVHEGAPGHEILFVFDVAFPAGFDLDRDHVVFSEHDGTVCVARWYDLGDLDREGGPRLFPEGLKGALLGREAIGHR